MPRIRSIHPGLFTDECFMSLSAYAMAAWPGIWIEADDQGVFEWKPLTLKARLLPCAAVDMGDTLAEYEARGMVCRFDVDGRNYGAIRNFRKFQRPEKPKAWHPLPEGMRSYVGLSPTDPQPVADPSPTAPRKSPQMEDGGDKMEKKGSAGAYAFEGAIIRLTAEHFGQWQAAYHAIPDFIAELRTIDAKLLDEGHQGKWFGRVSGWLKARHEKLLAERKPNGADGDDQWRMRLSSWTDATRGGPTPARWLADAWGPPPGQPGCRAPPRLLAEFDVIAAA